MSKSFDRVSDVYDETRGYPPGVAEAIQGWIERRLGLLPDRSRLLELGVGSGRIALPFIRAGYDYTGVDISPKMLALLKEKLGGDQRRASLLEADVTALPLPDRSFDAVIAVHILHLVDTFKALEEVIRVARPGGALVWGWDDSDPQSERAAVRKRYRNFLKQRGLASEGWDRNRQGWEWLAARGIPAAEAEVAAQWTITYTLRQVVDHVGQRVWSSTWDTPEDLHAAAMADLEAWAPATFGDLDAVRTCSAAFQVRVFHLP